MDRLYDLDALRPVSLFSPEVRLLQVDLEGGPGMENFGGGRRRAAEVLFVPYRAGGDVLLITKSSYPPGAYRLPTGGVERGESPRQAAAREIYEETGYRVAAPGLLGVIDYTLHHPEQAVPFVSYVFLAPVPADQAPCPTDPNEQIADYRWVAVADLAAAAATLRALTPPDWGRWGIFRAASYDFIAQAIIGYNETLEAGYPR